MENNYKSFLKEAISTVLRTVSPEKFIDKSTRIIYHLYKIDLMKALRIMILWNKCSLTRLIINRANSNIWIIRVKVKVSLKEEFREINIKCSKKIKSWFSKIINFLVLRNLCFKIIKLTILNFKLTMKIYNFKTQISTFNMKAKSFNKLLIGLTISSHQYSP